MQRLTASFSRQVNKGPRKVVGAVLEGHRRRAHCDSQQGAGPRWPRMTRLPYVLGRQRGVLGGGGGCFEKGGLDVTEMVSMRGWCVSLKSRSSRPPWLQKGGEGECGVGGGWWGGGVLSLICISCGRTPGAPAPAASLCKLPFDSDQIPAFPYEHHHIWGGRVRKRGTEAVSAWFWAKSVRIQGTKRRDLNYLSPTTACKKK